MEPTDLIKSMMNQVLADLLNQTNHVDQAEEGTVEPIEEEEEEDETVFWESYNSYDSDGYEFESPSKSPPPRKTVTTKAKVKKVREIRHRLYDQRDMKRKKDRTFQVFPPVKEEDDTGTTVLLNDTYARRINVFDQNDQLISVDGEDKSLSYFDSTCIKILKQMLKRPHTQEFRQYVDERLKRREELKLKRFGPHVYKPYYPNGELMDVEDYEEEMLNACRCYM